MEPIFNSGRFVDVSTPAKLVKFSFQGTCEGMHDWPRGKFVDASPIAPLIRLSFAPAITLTATLLPEADADSVFAKLKSLVEAVDKYDRTLGGTGLKLDAERSQTGSGTLKLVLVPLENRAISDILRSHLATLKNDGKALPGVQSLELAMAV